MTFWSEAELKAMSVVEFETTDAKGKKVTFRTPPCAKVSCPDGTPLVWNTQQGLGLSGAVSRFGGIGLAKGSITLPMGTAAHRQLFDEGCRKYLAAPAQGQPAKILTVKHPRLARIGVTQIKLMGEPAGDWDEQKQIETVVYQWEAYRKPLPTLSSATTAGQTKDGPKAKNDVNAGYRAVIISGMETLNDDYFRLTGKRIFTQPPAVAEGSVRQ
ncbi:hypothetical protein [Polyangium sp. 6x1]|uniref:hypothetical protein n=1 Tax=Polyangium sp. 6x1 TaxID=3042689 RepID=UPI002482FD1A|nr:hypothetical protein [Polyangium sp. 6x1]MDI1444209.1 hypothetical protein [Polyangium sp. 6x1]